MYRIILSHYILTKFDENKENKLKKHYSFSLHLLPNLKCKNKNLKNVDSTWGKHIRCMLVRLFSFTQIDLSALIIFKNNLRS